MTKQVIKDRRFRIVGYIETKDNGDKVIKDYRFRILGYYKKNLDQTQDAHFRLVARGDVSSSLIDINVFEK